MLTTIEENYLKVIYLLSKDGKLKVSATVIAVSLGINPASVIDMLKKLTEKKLTDYNKVNGAKLTISGIKIATLIVRKHRLWELFLQQKLGYSWDEVHEIAEQLEHVQDEKLADRLDELLGFPQYDPHGEAIPNSKGQIREMKLKTLQEVEIGKDYKVVSVKDTSKLFLQYLQRLHINIGAIIRVVEKIDFDGSMVIMLEKSTKATVSEKLTESILVS
jgi:DtxR family Mn-dependent transcriptional regulator